MFSENPRFFALLYLVGGDVSNRFVQEYSQCFTHGGIMFLVCFLGKTELHLFTVFSIGFEQFRRHGKRLLPHRKPIYFEDSSSPQT